MLVCNVSLRAPRRAIAADIAETAAALDASTTGFVVFAALVDDPANVLDIVDAYLGEIMLEAASASDAPDAGFAADLTIIETVIATDTTDGSKVVASTWNPADKLALTLSNGNLTAQNPSTGSSGVRSTGSKLAGKVYFEVTYNSPPANALIGVSNGTVSLSTIISSSQVGTSTVSQGGVIKVNNVIQAGSFSSMSNGQTICVAIDLVNSRIWYRVNAGNWNASGTADPATNVGGYDISMLFPTNAAYAYYGTFSPGTVTANFGAASFAQAVPSGFTAWG